MTNGINKAWLGNDNEPVQGCPVCEDRAQRDAQILATLQTLQRVFNGTDGIKSPMLKLARCKRAFDDLIRLMQPQTW